MEEVALVARRSVTLGPEPIAYPLGVEMGLVYEVRGPDGIRAVINDPTDKDFVGYLSEPPSGLERAEVRQSGQDLAGADGGINADGLFSRLAFTLRGTIHPDPQATNVLRQAKLLEASDAMDGDSLLLWTPSISGAIPVQVAFRASQATRITDRRPKTFLVAGVSEDPCVFSQELRSLQINYADGSGVLTQRGRFKKVWPQISLYSGVGGDWENPSLSNTSTGGSIVLDGYTGAGASIPAGHHLTIDTRPSQRSILFDDLVDWYDVFDFAKSTWWHIVPGNNTIAVDFSGASSTAFVTIAYRDAW